MDVITIESRAYKDIVSKIESIAHYVANATKPEENQEELDAWLDNDEVAIILNISTRTLQRLRTKGLISYSLLGGKCYYKGSDIEKALKDRVIRCTPEIMENFRKNFIFHVSKR
ncbi:carbamoylphosphate synthase small subunit [Dysgonomonas sp. PFB1-18]|uniref:helix-turn-helix domain-containing protein n=1 Tax=unclassified Dysgonomonas TaxID=2630389 RepID=UPI0013D0D23D|nr:MULTISPECIES: helix-turn-helix domain-containing protein [unclassified Dysgonomonas]MDH6310068.1 carbamoylphosphate synthase small subunit [Dysgonomonas sp. PF1-14]MDH6339977.1 carbamoylphosphate synthase small subunit [Dysgonomonas sp. PF1-16]MDH6381625.1 carbamoylphosphate synthase small subunit [Dysgonomonas sp. PFB1-18]MDH6398737.1 carbamoylphosphate synthase small subunit [Dysgonomonas sp. PF1-23]NDV93584.1 DNA-binding protein [Dysgonomonas sp. 521]